MAAVKNVSSGPRGAYNKGNLVMAEPGVTIEADDYSEEWFEAEGKGAAKADPKPEKDAKAK